MARSIKGRASSGGVQSSSSDVSCVGEAEYEVVRIVGKRFYKGTWQYQVEWSGHPPGRPNDQWPLTWEPMEHLYNSIDSIAEFESILAPYGHHLEASSGYLRWSLRTKHRKTFPDERLPVHIQYTLNPTMEADEFEELLITRKCVVYYYTVGRVGNNIKVVPGGEEWHPGWNNAVLRICIEPHRK